MISRQKKQQLVEKISELVSGSGSVIFTDFSGLSTKELNELKTELRNNEVGYRVTKKSLWPLALRKAKIKDESSIMVDHKGSIGVAYSKDEGMAAAKIITRFQKVHKEFSILGGLVENVFVDLAKIVELSRLPSREELIGRFIYVISAPISFFARVLNANQRDLVGVIEQIKKSKNK